jgi:hypothetical protein
MLSNFAAMPKNNLPTYAIVELLIRLSTYNSGIGDYKDHAVKDDEVMVKTSGGMIRFPVVLIEQQFSAPEQITEDALFKASLQFKPSN